MKKLVYFIGALVVLVLVLSKMVETPTTSFTDVKKDAIFIEDIACDKPSLKGKELYDNLDAVLKSGSTIESKDYSITFFSTKPQITLRNNNTPIDYQIVSGGAIDAGIVYMVKNDNDKGVITIQNEVIQPNKNTVMVKIITDKIRYCKRGVITDLLK